METSGIQPVPIQQRVSDPSHALRVNQRISAEILKVAADHVVLALDGFPVIAQLTSSDQTAELADRKQAQFVVKDSSGNQLLLQVVPDESARAAANTNETTLISRLLNHFGIPLDEANVNLAQELIEAGLPVTQEAVTKLRELLDQFGSWGRQQARTAVQLQKAGIPLNPTTIKLALSDHPGIVKTLSNLYTGLQNIEPSQIPFKLRSTLQNVLKFLDQVLSSQSTLSTDPEALASYVKSLGSTIENSLFRLLSRPETAEADPLFQILTLRSQLQQTNQPEAANLIDQFLNELQFQGLQNIIPSDQQQDGRWFTMELPFLSIPEQVQERKPRQKTAQLRISYEHQNGETAINPKNTHIRLHFPITETRELFLDLVLAENAISARINTSDDELQGIAEQELPDLKSGLEALGYQLQRVECLVNSEFGSETETGPTFYCSLPDTAVNVEA